MLCLLLASGAPQGASFPRRSFLAPQSRRRRAPSAHSWCASGLLGVALGFLDRTPDPFGGAGHGDVVDAERAQGIDDRVDHRGSRGDGARLTDALDPEPV